VNRRGERAVVLDTMAVSAIVNANRDPAAAADYRSLVAGRPIVVSFATVTEMRYGAIKAGWGQLRRRALDRDLARLVVVQPDDEMMGRCAGLRAECEKAGLALGQKIHEADRWIAATALVLGVDLVSQDAVFRSVPGLRVLSRPG
jgi:predicted nucleic acid-binding protein